MPRLGSLVLASVLLGVPRALEARTFGAPQRAVYVEVARPTRELGAFAEAVSEALAGSAWSLVSFRSEATVLIDVESVVKATDARGRPLEVFTVCVREGRRVRRLVLQGAARDRAGAARALIGRLSRLDS